MTTIAQQLDNVLALAEKATPGPWINSHDWVIGDIGNPNNKFNPTVCMDCDPPDAELIARAVNFLRQHGPAIRAAVGGEAVAADIAAARRERDEAREAQEYAELELAYLANEMIFNGNSIGWTASKADKYKAALGRAWDAVKEVGGKCDGNTELADAIRQQLIASPPATVDAGALAGFLARLRERRHIFQGAMPLENEAEDLQMRAAIAENTWIAEELAALIGERA